MTNQKFHHGDLVHVAKDLGEFMGHFHSDVEAIVLYSYAEKHGGGEVGENGHSYAVFIEDCGYCAWYFESQMQVVHTRQHELLERWERKITEFAAMRSDLDWIFANAEEVITNGWGASVQALADCMDFGTLWGSRGEGIDYAANHRRVLLVAIPFLRTGTKSSWLEACEIYKRARAKRRQN